MTPGPDAGLLDVVRRLLDDDPGAVVLYDGADGAKAPEPVSRAELWRQGGVLATHLRDLGVGSGDCVGVWLPNWSSTVAAQLAALALGAHVIGINTRYNGEEVAHVLQKARPAALLVAYDFKGLDLPRRLAAALDIAQAPRPPLLVVAAPGSTPAVELDAYAVGAPDDAAPVVGVDFTPGAGPDPLELASNAPHRLAVAFTTSGSTGRPKLAAHTDGAVAVHAVAVGERIGFGADDVFLGALPLSGVFGFNASMGAIASGASVLLEPVFDAPKVLRDMAEVGVTHIVGADDLVGRIAGQWRTSREHLALRWIGIADFEGRSRELATWAQESFGAVVVGVYGSSELFALTAFWPEDTDESLRREPGGRVVLAQTEVRVVDPVTEVEVAVAHEGELQFRGPNVVDAYLGDDDQAISRHSFTSDGWFHSGDIGTIVAPGTFRYVCRMGDALRLRGFLVDPAEIELRLLAHGDVRLAKVVGVTPRSGGGTQAVAFVVPVEGGAASAEELQRWCADALAAFKVPTRVEMVEEMPVTSGTNGTKIRAAALRDIAAQWPQFR